MTDKKFNQFIEKIISKLEDTKKDTIENIDIIFKAIKKFIPSDDICIFVVNEENHTLINMQRAGKESSIYTLNTKGSLSQCYHSKEVLFTNDIHRSSLYNDKLDGFTDKNIVKVLTVPIFDIDKNLNIVGIIQVGISKGFCQFVQEDIDSLVYFIDSVKKYLFDLSDTMEEKSKKELEEKIKVNENYFASTIHDIRTPMNAVVGFMELMMLDETDEQKREYIDAVLKSSEHIVSLINNALDISKISNDKMNLEETTFSPLEGINDIAKLFYSTMKKKSIDFIIDIDPLLPELIFSDLHRIKQIINNLLSNAIKFTPSEGTVTLKTVYNKEKDTLLISVIDTGIGIDKEKQKSIFDPYTQETDSTSREYGGTGLGLAISQKLSLLLNGMLTLKSEQGEGSEFIFEFPCNTSSSTQITDNPLKKYKLTDQELKFLKGKTVMVIDDCVINLKLMVEILNRLNLEVTTYLNAKEALKILENEIFDIIFIDQNMPLMSGDEAIVQIRKNEKKMKTKPKLIYSLTGDTNRDTLEKIIKSGANTILTKPIHIEDIFYLLSKDI